VEPGATTLPKGSLFEDRYEILEELGVGSFGRVYRARQLSTGQSVALKLLSVREGGDSSTAREADRFRRESRICAELSHPNIVGLIDSGETRDGQLYAVFAYVPGETLEQTLAREGALGVRETLRLMTQVLEALASAHARGIVHRDLKPANVMLTGTAPRRTAVVLDFGLGGLAEGVLRKQWRTLTQTREFLGTPMYAAPEQLAGQAVTPRSDLYAWGLIFLECLTGRHPFAGEGGAERRFSGSVEIPGWLRTHRLGSLLAAATARDVQQRDVSAVTLIEALDGLSSAGSLPVPFETPVGSASATPSTLGESGAGGGERRLAAIVNGDVVGYSRLMAEDEDATVRMVTFYRQQVEMLVPQHRGSLVDFTGDNFLAQFPTALEAVRCSVEIQRVLRARNADRPPERRMQFRIGVHLGDVRETEGRLFGSGVTIGARLQGLAEPGGICISEAVREQLRGKLDVDLEDLGARRVKNIPEPAHCYGVKLDAPPAAAAAGPAARLPVGWRAAAAALALLVAAAAGWWLLAERGSAPLGASQAPIRSLAVLPLENLSGDPEQEYFADGMTEALIGELARLGALRVISRTSVMQYKGERKPLPEIARELGVEGIVEGTVMRAGDRVRINAQLVDARSDRHLWNDHFDRDLSDVLALQADVALAVAQRVRLELTPQQHAGLASRSVDPAAYDAYLRGRALVGPWGEVRDWAPGALEQLERAVDPDPGLAEAWAWIAYVRMSLGTLGYRQRDRRQYPRAREAAQRALDLDERLGMAHAVLGHVLMLYGWDFPAAGREFERGMELSPGDPAVVNGLAWFLLFTGKPEQPLALSERLPRIAPHDLFFRAEHFRHLRFARKNDQALEELARVREVAPAFTDSLIAPLFFALGRLEEAHRAQIAYYESCGKRCDPAREAALRGWAEGGWAGSMRAVAGVYAAVEGFSPTVIAFCYSLAGDTDEAFVWLEEGYRQREPLLASVKGQPSFDPLRSDPRFDDLVRRIGFPAD
jgi:adenylate cyclase